MWFLLPDRPGWLAFLCACAALAAGTAAMLRRDGRFPFARQALVLFPLIMAAGCLTVWSKSALVGAAPIERPLVATLAGTVLVRQNQPAEQRVRLTLAVHEPGSGRAIRVRVNLKAEHDRTILVAGARVRLRARLMPPAPPMLPGGHDFARSAWFRGLAATGSVLGPVEVIAPGTNGGFIAGLQASLSAHVQANLTGSSGAIATALASGDRGNIAESDAQAMRDSGLAHLLSISGLHVSAVVAAAYVMVIRLLALFPPIALRVRLPLVAAGAGALAGVGYTLLTGAEVPTVRSCIGAVLVLVALALGREPLSLRMLAVAALVVLLFWPESIVGPSFQMSFASVLAIVALHGAAPVRRFLAPREEGWPARGLRNLAMLLLTGLVIELALMPIGLFHFHRAGVYGAFANVVAIPLTTLVTMPLIALALTLDLVSIGGPAWWLTGHSIDAMLWLAHRVSGLPGAVSVHPSAGLGPMIPLVGGGLWLALWKGRVRLWGAVPILAGGLAMMLARGPDILVSGDGHHVGIVDHRSGALVLLRDSASDYARDNITELAGMNGAVRQLSQWDGAHCSRDFCVVTLERHGRTWRIMLSRSRDTVPERELAAACERVDIVIADRWLPRSCRPRWLKADRNMLGRTGGLAIDLGTASVTTVADTQGEHGWWRGNTVTPYRPRPGSLPLADPSGSATVKTGAPPPRPDTVGQ